ncbi:RNA polymerase subunit sigma [Salipaludibacillus neizhouensis]|uniref:RNA polymerase subunit sigma n=1 Tax=Salipaludibacillus neizhouensis TaxID=885475 RepID=A0A3A9KCN6_9BACI|nr:sigma-70 family RNA polymerase sigma factor [Salipaludibacillus neizhouensis]RKL65155.1 RNA polymerase subunit sigma [Salipaludibacillus neizhouensis]
MNEPVEDCDYIKDKEEWIGMIFDKYGDQLLRLCFNYVKDWGKAEDLVQEVLVQCYIKIDEFRGEASLKNWIYRIATNRCKDVLKSYSFRRVFLHNFQSHQMASKEYIPEDTMLEKEETEILVKLIFKLPIKYREVILLYYYEELRIFEIASILSINESTVKTRLRRSKHKLKKGLEREGNYIWKNN